MTELQIGQIDKGLVNDLEQVVYDSGELGSAAPSVTITGGHPAQNELAFLTFKILATSGSERTIIGESMGGVSGTTVAACAARGGVWNNTTDNITSITIFAD